MKKRGHQGVSNTEFAVLSALWSANKPLPRPEILERLPEMDWNPNSIHLVLNGLIDKGLLTVDGLVRCGQSYGRTYVPTISQLDYAAEQALKVVKDLPAEERLVGVVSALLSREEPDSATLDALEQLLQSYRQQEK